MDGGVLLFSTGDAAETFAERDPYVVNGIVTSWTIREWSVVAGSLELPPVPPFQASYEWKRVEPDQVCPPGLEVEMPLDGGQQRARIPPEWTARMNIKDTQGVSFTFDLNYGVTRHTTVGEMRRAAALHASNAGTFGEVPTEQISISIDGRLGELDDDSQTAEELDLFSHASSLKAAIRTVKS